MRKAIPIEHKRCSAARGPIMGDDRYWFHLVPRKAVRSLGVHPKQPVLLAARGAAIDMDLYHTWLVELLRWIPLAAGDWSDLPDSRIFMDKNGAPTARRIFRALADLIAAGPAVVELPGPRVVRTTARSRSVVNVRLCYPRDELQNTFRQLGDFAEAMEGGEHLLFCSHWVERGMA